MTVQAVDGGDQCQDGHDIDQPVFVVREARAVDVGRGLLDVLRQLVPFGDVTPDRVAEVFRQRHDLGTLTLVAVRPDGSVIGTASVWFEFKFKGIAAHVEDVVVLAEWRDQGVGTRLMRVALDVSRLRGCYKVVLATGGAEVFYERLGFRRLDTGMRIDLTCY